MPDHWDIGQREAWLRDATLTDDLETNIQITKNLYGNSIDLIIHRFKLGTRQISGALLCLDGMSNNETIEMLIEKIKIDAIKININQGSGPALQKILLERLLTIYKLKEVNGFEELCNSLSSGMTALLFVGSDTAIVCETTGFSQRGIEEPSAETTIRGPRDGFVENIKTNGSLIRRRIKTPNLWFRVFRLGHLTKTQVAVAYIKGLASEELVAEVCSRIERIETDAILESGYIEDYIEDNPFTLFPLTFRTEKPDRITSCLLEGKVAIITDGTPFVLVVPTTFFKLLHAPDDYYEKVPIGAFIRALRLFSYIASVLLPGAYVAVINFHQELIPTTLLLRITASRQGLPFPIIFEALFIELAFEVLREAGVRLPRAIGPAISIVGALVLGEAAIRAGFVSPVMIIVVALTAIASFTVPVFSIGISGRLLRFGFIILGGVLGLFGIQIGAILMMLHLCSLRSFGIPYFSPAGPLIWSEWKDFIFRHWRWGLTTRPKLMGFREPIRGEAGLMPGVRHKRRKDDS
ncbi:MAG: spore germination protein [bacterium]